MIDTVPPISDDTHTSELSRLNSAKRGRASTSTLATIWRVAVSMKCAMLVVSDVLIRILPSGLIAMPSGSTPTWMSPIRARFSRSMMVTVLSFSLATYRILPAASRTNSSGSGPEGRVVDHLLGRDIDHLDSVVVADGDEHELAVPGELDAARALVALSILATSCSLLFADEFVSRSRFLVLLEVRLSAHPIALSVIQHEQTMVTKTLTKSRST